MRRFFSSSCLALALTLVALDRADAVMPTSIIRFTSTPGWIYAAQADFGGDMPSASHPLQLLVLQPAGAKDGCKPQLPDSMTADTARAMGYDGIALLVSRGNCSFEKKAVAAQSAGASAVIIYNSVEGIWSNRTSVEDLYDYECKNGASWITNVVEPSWSSANDRAECHDASTCKSHRCLVTSNTDADKGTQICCAWDLYITMGPDASAEQEAPPTIPAVFVTMADSDALLKAVSSSSSSSASGGALTISLSERRRPWMNLSSFFIWAMGVFTVVLASWNAARRMRPKHKPGAGGSRTAELVGERRGGGGDEEEEEEVAVDLSVGHTVGFIVMASCFLILLFYVNLNAVINVLYCFSAGSAVSGMLARPVMKRLLPRPLSSRVLVNSTRLGMSLSFLDVLSTAMGLGMAFWWYVVRTKASYAWVLQDIMGMSLCVLFLSLVRFPNIKVATVLLCLAFFYDIFFVFISPLFFKESVMVKVATGGVPKADPTFCEKYPSAHDCQTREELPMLLVLPRIHDYQGGFTMLGLGDIILPGLLVAFAARYDYSVGVPLTRGYFRLMVWGYAIGLLMANLAVYLMATGQPALLYLVPCTLGVFVAVAYKEGTLQHMWNGPPSLNPHAAPRRPTAGVVPGVTVAGPGGPHHQHHLVSTTDVVLGGGGGGGGGGAVGGGAVAAAAPLSILPTTEEEPLLDP